MGHRGGHKVVISIPLYVKLLSGGQVRHAKVASGWNVWIRDPCTQVLIRGVQSLSEAKLATIARQTWIVHALGKLLVARVADIHRIIGSAILGACVHRLLKGTTRCLRLRGRMR